MRLFFFIAVALIAACSDRKPLTEAVKIPAYSYHELWLGNHSPHSDLHFTDQTSGKILITIPPHQNINDWLLDLREQFTKHPLFTLKVPPTFSKHKGTYVIYCAHPSIDVTVQSNDSELTIKEGNDIPRSAFVPWSIPEGTTVILGDTVVLTDYETIESPQEKSNDSN